MKGTNVFESSDLIEGEFSPLYNTLSKYLPDDFPPGPPFGNERDEIRYDLIKTIESINCMNNLIWGSNIGKFHGFLWDKVPISFNWFEFEINYGPKLDALFSDPQKAQDALKEIYVAFGYREDSWRRGTLAIKNPKMLFIHALKSLARRHEAIGNRDVKKINYGLKDLTKMMFGTQLKVFDRRMKKLPFSDIRKKELMKFSFEFLMVRAKYVAKTKKVKEILEFKAESGIYIFTKINEPPSWLKKYQEVNP